MNKIDLAPVLKLRMGSGIGSATLNGGIHGETACLVAQAAIIDAIRSGREIATPTDDLECACPLLRNFAIRINDAHWWKDDDERTETLRPLIPLLLDSKVDLKATKRRGLRYVDCYVRELIPLVMDKINLKEAVRKLRALPPIVDEQTILGAREVCAGLNLARARAHDLALALARALAFAHDLDLALDLARARDLDLALDLARARDLDLTLALARARDLDLVLDRARAHALAHDLRSKSLALDLRSKSLALFEELAAINDENSP